VDKAEAAQSVVVPRRRGDSSPTSVLTVRLAPSVRANSSRPAAVNPPAGFLVTTPRRLLRVATTSYCRRQRSCCLQGWGMDALLSWHDSSHLPLLAGSVLCVSHPPSGFPAPTALWSQPWMRVSLGCALWVPSVFSCLTPMLTCARVHVDSVTGLLVWRLRGLPFRSGQGGAVGHAAPSLRY